MRKGRFFTSELDATEVAGKVMEVVKGGGLVGNTAAWRNRVRQARNGKWFLEVPGEVARKLHSDEFKDDDLFACLPAPDDDGDDIENGSVH